MGHMLNKTYGKAINTYTVKFFLTEFKIKNLFKCRKHSNFLEVTKLDVFFLLEQVLNFHSICFILS